METIVFHADSWQVLSLAVGTILPLLVGLVTKQVTGSNVKAMLLLFLAALTAIGSELLTANEVGQTFDLGRAVLVAVGTFLVGVGLHFGLYKPTGATEVAQKLGVK